MYSAKIVKPTSMVLRSKTALRQQREPVRRSAPDDHQRCVRQYCADELNGGVTDRP